VAGVVQPARFETGSPARQGPALRGNPSASLVGSTGVVASTDTGPIDLVASPGGRYLYAQAGGAGAIDEFAVNSDGTLSSLGTVAGLNPGIEGIATD
jgi:hypothetical protein